MTDGAQNPSRCLDGREERGAPAEGAAAQQSICDTRAGPVVAVLPLLHPSPGSRISCGMGMLVFISKVWQSCFPLIGVPGQVPLPAASSMAFRSSNEPGSQDRLLLPATASTLLPKPPQHLSSHNSLIII